LRICGSVMPHREKRSPADGFLLATERRCTKIMSDAGVPAHL
jgi:hypothetical protein